MTKSAQEWYEGQVDKLKQNYEEELAELRKANENLRIENFESMNRRYHELRKRNTDRLPGELAVVPVPARTPQLQSGEYAMGDQVHTYSQRCVQISPAIESNAQATGFEKTLECRSYSRLPQNKKYQPHYSSRNYAGKEQNVQRPNNEERWARVSNKVIEEIGHTVVSPHYPSKEWTARYSQSNPSPIATVLPRIQRNKSVVDEKRHEISKTQEQDESESEDENLENSGLSENYSDESDKETEERDDTNEDLEIESVENEVVDSGTHSEDGIQNPNYHCANNEVEEHVENFDKSQCADTQYSATQHMDQTQTVEQLPNLAENDGLDETIAEEIEIRQEVKTIQTRKKKKRKGSGWSIKKRVTHQPSRLKMLKDGTENETLKEVKGSNMLDEAKIARNIQEEQRVNSYEDNKLEEEDRRNELEMQEKRLEMLQKKEENTNTQNFAERSNLKIAEEEIQGDQMIAHVQEGQIKCKPGRNKNLKSVVTTRQLRPKKQKVVSTEVTGKTQLHLSENKKESLSAEKSSSCSKQKLQSTSKYLSSPMQKKDKLSKDKIITKSNAAQKTSSTRKHINLNKIGQIHERQDSALNKKPDDYMQMKQTMKNKENIGIANSTKNQISDPVKPTKNGKKVQGRNGKACNIASVLKQPKTNGRPQKSNQEQKTPKQKARDKKKEVRKAVVDKPQKTKVTVTKKGTKPCQKQSDLAVGTQASQQAKNKVISSDIQVNQRKCKKSNFSTSISENTKTNADNVEHPVRDTDYSCKSYLSPATNITYQNQELSQYNSSSSAEESPDWKSLEKSFSNIQAKPKKRSFIGSSSILEKDMDNYKPKVKVLKKRNDQHVFDFTESDEEESQATEFSKFRGGEVKSYSGKRSFNGTGGRVHQEEWKFRQVRTPLWLKQQ